MALVKKAWRAVKPRHSVRYYIVSVVFIVCVYTFLTGFLHTDVDIDRTKGLSLPVVKNLNDCDGHNNGQPCERKKRKKRKKSVRHDSNHFSPSTTDNNSTHFSQHCVKYQIVKKHQIHSHPAACIPHRPSDASCKLAQLIYKRNNKLKSCGQNAPIEICRRRSNETLDFKCSLDQCAEVKRGRVRIWTPVEHGKDLKATTRFYTDATSLEKDVSYYAHQAVREGTQFLFLECTDGKEREKYDTVSQFLLLPSLELPKSKNTSKKNNSGKMVNINIVLLDSTARSHFFRSLPTVVKTFNEINSDANHPAEILDFQLFQSLHGHTAENLHALFTGDLFPKHWTNEDRENVALGAEVLFNEYSDAGE